MLSSTQNQLSLEYHGNWMGRPSRDDRAPGGLCAEGGILSSLMRFEPDLASDLVQALTSGSTWRETVDVPPPVGVLPPEDVATGSPCLLNSGDAMLSQQDIDVLVTGGGGLAKRVLSSDPYAFGADEDEESMEDGSCSASVSPDQKLMMTSINRSSPARKRTLGRTGSIEDGEDASGIQGQNLWRK